ncbi:MAG: hypothetical protein C0410_04030 [Anaerolinea sp.]|nr:hypothetical protein [Anaerolinea sp.]
MKNKSTFRLISIGFLSGIIFSGTVFIVLNLIIHNSSQNILIDHPSILITESEQRSGISSDGKIDLNQATLKDLIALPGIGEARANAIIDFREKYGAFEDLSELSYVPGIGNILLNSIQDLVIIN